jgi:hypothetical protein
MTSLAQGENASRRGSQVGQNATGGLLARAKDLSFRASLSFRIMGFGSNKRMPAGEGASRFELTASGPSNA